MRAGADASESGRDPERSGKSAMTHVFVAGNSRSGTTVTAKMLGRHSHLHTLPELHFVEELWLPSHDGVLSTDEAVELADRLLHNARRGYHEPYRHGADIALARCLTAGMASPHPHDVLVAVLTSEARRHGKTGSVEQTPRNVYFLGDLLSRLPSARAVIVIRDPRDVLLSQRNWWRRRWRGSRVPLQTTIRRWTSYHPVTTTLLWRSGVRSGDAWASLPGVTVIRFEDLVADPKSVLTRLLEQLGLTFEGGMLEVPRISSSNRPDPRTEHPEYGLDPSVVGGGLRDLSATELWLCQLLTRRERSAHGYVDVGVRPRPLALLGHLVSLPLKAGAGLALNTRRTRSLLQTVRRRLIGSGGGL
jgi:hypothetical protein